MRAASIVALSIFAGLCAIPLLVWALSFVDPAPEQDDCAFNSLSKNDYQELLRRAKAEDWTVWPALSNGIFWPSDRGILPPTAAVETAAGDQLLRFVRRLASKPASSDQELASAHAVMRSIGAEYVSVWNVPDFRQNGKLVTSQVYFNYFLPQVRFAPLCFLCLAWWHTNIRVVFVHDIEAGTYALSGILVVNSDFKSNLKKERSASGSCPSFPEQLHKPKN